jgi:hypothetical protein
MTIHMVLWGKKIQCHFTTNVWSVIIEDVLIGPIIVDDCMTGHNYLDFKQKCITKTTRGFYFGNTDCYVISA